MDDLIKRHMTADKLARIFSDAGGSDALVDLLADFGVARLREALEAYTEYCNICHGRGTIIEADDATGAILWNDCPGCTPARAALEAKP